MATKREIVFYLRNIKNGKVRLNIDILDDEGDKIGVLRPVMTREVADNSEIVSFIAKWREHYKENFLTQFKVTDDGTKNWLKNQIIRRDDKILFLVETIDGKLLGHEGVIFFENNDSSCELDNLVKSADCKIPGIMTYAEKSLIKWLFGCLGMEKITLRVFSDNLKTQALHHRCGFLKTGEIGLKKEIGKELVRYVEMTETDKQTADRVLFKMEFKK